MKMVVVKNWIFQQRESSHSNTFTIDHPSLDIESGTTHDIGLYVEEIIIIIIIIMVMMIMHQSKSQIISSESKKNLNFYLSVYFL